MLGCSVFGVHVYDNIFQYHSNYEWWSNNGFHSYCCQVQLEICYLTFKLNFKHRLWRIFISELKNAFRMHSGHLQRNACTRFKWTHSIKGNTSFLAFMKIKDDLSLLYVRINYGIILQNVHKQNNVNIYYFYISPKMK